MSGNGKRIRGRVPYTSGKRTPFQPGDEQHCYSRESLLRMDKRFCAAVERAIRLGLEKHLPLVARQKAVR